MAMDVEAEIRRRAASASSFALLSEQIGILHKDLLAFQARTEQHFDRLDQRFDSISGKFDKIDGRLDRIDSLTCGLRTAIPKIVGETMREVLREQKSKS